MRIAYVSFEYPPDTAVGGIATYVYQASKMMKSRGHDVEVFCASSTRTVSEEFEGVLVHRIVADTKSFPKQVIPVFQERHLQQKFDLIESPEYSGDGYEIKKQFPQLPLVVKLHTPAYFIYVLNNYYSSKTIAFYQKFRFILGGLIRGKIREPYWNKLSWVKDENDIDYKIAIIADQIHTPSISLGDLVSAKWEIDRSRILNVPYPFIPTDSFLRIPIVSTSTKNVTFIGRLETRKGLVAFVEAIPIICQAIPNVKIRFVGKVVGSIIPGMDTKKYIESKLAKYLGNIEFTQVTPSDIPLILAGTDVSVFPSIWENFPNVCLEAMSAGRAIVASNQGGMKDMLEEPKAGVLINPLNHREIAQAVISLLNNPGLRVKLGEVAREKVLSAYNSNKIGDLMEKCYQMLIK